MKKIYVRRRGCFSEEKPNQPKICVTCNMKYRSEECKNNRVENNMKLGVFNFTRNIQD